MEPLLIETSNLMDKVIQSYEREISKIRTGRANPSILDDVKVKCYGDIQSLKTLASIKIPEAKQILITPYDQSITKSIAEAILHHNLQVQIQHEANSVRLIFPDLTEETRKTMVKELGKISEVARVHVRNERRDSLHKLKNLELSEDIERKVAADIQKLTDKKIDLISEVESNKARDLMKI